MGFLKVFYAQPFWSVATPHKNSLALVFAHNDRLLHFLQHLAMTHYRKFTHSPWIFSQKFTNSMNFHLQFSKNSREFRQNSAKFPKHPTLAKNHNRKFSAWFFVPQVRVGLNLTRQEVLCSAGQRLFGVGSFCPFCPTLKMLFNVVKAGVCVVGLGGVFEVLRVVVFVGFALCLKDFLRIGAEF